MISEIVYYTVMVAGVAILMRMLKIRRLDRY